jgi:hypothetical protein
MSHISDARMQDIAQLNATIGYLQADLTHACHVKKGYADEINHLKSQIQTKNLEISKLTLSLLGAT